MVFQIQPYGLQAMLKEGHRHLSGLEEAVLKNIEACQELSTITRTSLGPNGMNKMVINHLDKLFVTNDAATIVNELEVQHPAAKVLVLAGKAQQEEVGDGANLTISFGGELLHNAGELIRTGLHPSEIVSGYTKGINKTIEILDELVEKGSETMDVRDKDEVVLRMRATVASKQFGQEDILCPLITDACIQVCPKNPANFNVDNVRVAKLIGGGLHDCCILRGMVLKHDAVGSIKKMEKAKIAVFAGGVDTSATETKGTVLIQSAEQLENYAKTEEAKVEELIRAVANSGAKVIVSGGAVGDMALHFCERYKLMVLKISSKFELRRFCRTTGAVALLKLSQPGPDELGYADSVSVEEIGGVRATIVKNEEGGNSVSTVVLRASTDSILDDLERAVDDGVNSYKAMCRDSRIVPGAAATEIELARKLKEFSFQETGLDQYAIAKFAESFEMVPKTLAENAGLNAIEIVSSLYAEHASGNNKVGINLEEGVCKDASLMKVWDLYVTKYFALKYATDAASTVLRVDQVELSCINGDSSLEITYVVSLYPVSMATAVIVKNKGLEAVKLTSAMLSHLKFNSRRGSAIQGLTGCSYHSYPPLSSSFGIMSPAEAMEPETPSGLSAFLGSMFSGKENPTEDEQNTWRVEDNVYTILRDKLSRVYAAPPTERLKRIYNTPPSKFETIDQGSGLGYRVIRMGYDDIYLGSPGSLSQKYGKDYFICTGPASMLVPVVLNPSEVWRGAQAIEHDNL